MNLQDLWIAQYSAARNEFHCQPLSQAVGENQARVARQEKGHDWVTVRVGSEAEAQTTVRILREIQAAHAPERIQPPPVTIFEPFKQLKPSPTEELALWFEKMGEAQQMIAQILRAKF